MNNTQPPHPLQHDDQPASTTPIFAYEYFKRQSWILPGFDLSYDDSRSASTSYAASVASIFTVASSASSASHISRGTGYSVNQIETATKELLSIFNGDRILLPLYRSVLENPNIGPDRLQRNLRRLFRAYAVLLESEAAERLEYLAARLVFFKSSVLARSIVEKLRSGPASTRLPDRERHDESSGG